MKKTIFFGLLIILFIIFNSLIFIKKENGVYFFRVNFWSQEGMTLCNFIFLGTETNQYDIIHELFHVKQQRSKGCLKLIMKGAIQQGKIYIFKRDETSLYAFNVSDFSDFNEEQEATLMEEYYFDKNTKGERTIPLCLDCCNFSKQERRFLLELQKAELLEKYK